LCDARSELSTPEKLHVALEALKTISALIQGNVFYDYFSVISEQRTHFPVMEHYRRHLLEKVEEARKEAKDGKSGKALDELVEFAEEFAGVCLEEAGASHH